MSGVTLPDSLVNPLGFDRGQRALIAGTAPAAGASFSLALDPRYVWRLMSVYAEITTDANVANREVVLQYLDGNGKVFDNMGGAVTFPASSTAIPYTFSSEQTVAEWTVNSGVIVPLHAVFLPGGYVVKLLVVNVQATDQLANIRLYAERFYTDVAR